MPDIEVAVNINPRSIDEAIRWGRLFEGHGVARLGVWDSPVGVPECWTTLGALSQCVTRVPLGVSVTNPRTRHPAVTASALAGLSGETAAGVFLGIGTGDSGVYNLGGRAATLRDLRAYVQAVREFLARRATAAKVLVAAHGMRSLEVAAEIGDGVIVGLGHSEEVVAAVTAVTGHDVEVWWNTGTITIDLDGDRAEATGGWVLASLAHHFTRFGLESKLVPAGLRSGVEQLGALYDLSRHGVQTEEDKRRYVEAAKMLGVWDHLADRFLIAGTESEVVKRLDELSARGVRRLEMGTANGQDAAAAALSLISRRARER
ncbi:LLM class flavin-dependent oxidoreductase [Lentzea californiensis]|uniref:LLM class flavin-dependent oxidoreductase n=1 Tax=Lentzea californiensis TaxID=438851 RepID=UPI002165B790|nr:LLM class flavin-dependent oxidoreductase [Lentzea californiensis]MCR3752078.1 5,10-methylenetetrahydromethanopterin reductase [Lentzea californiensis]